MVDGLSPTVVIVAVFSYPAYLLIMACVLGVCGVPRKEIAKWALRQAERQRMADLVRSWRRQPVDSLRRQPLDEPERAPEVDRADGEPPR